METFCDGKTLDNNCKLFRWKTLDHNYKFRLMAKFRWQLMWIQPLGQLKYLLYDDVKKVWTILIGWWRVASLAIEKSTMRNNCLIGCFECGRSYYVWVKFLSAVICGSPRLHSNSSITFQKIGEKKCMPSLGLAECCKTMKNCNPLPPLGCTSPLSKVFLHP